MTAAKVHTWTDHTFVCRACGDTCRASKESIADYRSITGDGPEWTDAQIVESFEYCRRCSGEKVEGERVEPIREVVSTLNGKRVSSITFPPNATPERVREAMRELSCWTVGDTITAYSYSGKGFDVVASMTREGREWTTTTSAPEEAPTE